MSVITCKFLAGQRMGNACFIYAFAKAYALKHKCQLQCPEWFGRKLFVNAGDPMIKSSLPHTELDADLRAPLNYFFGRVDIDLKGYFQHQTFLDFYSRAQVREWFKLKPEFENYSKFSGHSAAHIRKGDYVNDPGLARLYCDISEKSYDRAIEQFRIPQPVFRVQEGWRAPHPELQKQGIGWLSDFLLLRDAAHLLRANSSFSWWAAAIGSGKVYSPMVEDKVGRQEIAFTEGNWPCTAGRFRNQSALHLKE